MTDSLPPATEASLQRYVAVLLLEDVDFLRAFRSILKPEHFASAEMRFLVNFALSFYDKHRMPPTRAAFAAEVETPTRTFSQSGVQPELMAYLARMVCEENVPGPSLKEYVRDRLERYIQEREFEMAVRSAAVYLDQGAIDRAFEVVRAAQRVRAERDTYLTFPDDMGALYDYFAPERLAAISVPLGLAPLDAAMGGGLRPGELGVILAALKVGKSSFLVYVGAMALRRGLSVAHISLENSAHDTYGRYLANLTGTPVEELITRGLTEADLRELVERTLRRLDSEAKAFIYWMPARLTSIDDISVVVDDLCADHKIGLVVVDYGDLVRSRERYERPYEEQAAAFAELRDLGAQFNVPVWTATQANRQALSARTVRVSQISESLGKAMKADFVLALSQTAEEADQTPPRMRIGLIAARRGPGRCSVSVEALLGTARFREVVDDDQELDLE